MTIVVQQESMAITPATSNQLNFNISVTRGVGMNYLWFIDPSCTPT